VQKMPGIFSNWRTANEFGEHVWEEYAQLEGVLHKELLDATEEQTAMSINAALDRLFAAYQQVSNQVLEVISTERQVRSESPEFFDKAREAELRAQEAEARADERREGFGA